MNKIASILLITVLLFNWVGFRLASAWLQARSTAELIVNLDNNQYRDAELISLKIPSSLPYYIGSGQYERIDGEIELNGIHYNYVKRRVTADSIEYLCIPNREKTALKQASDNFYKLVNDIQQNTPSKKDNSGFIKMLTSDYDRCGNEITFTCGGAAEVSLHRYLLAAIIPVSIAPIELPPNALTVV